MYDGVFDACGTDNDTGLSLKFQMTVHESLEF